MKYEDRELRVVIKFALIVELIAIATVIFLATIL